MRRITFIFVFICHIFFCLQAPAQEPVLSKLENDIALNKIKLKEQGIIAQDREKIFTQLAYDINQLAEIHFNKNEYEKATKLFVEADAFTRQFHESTYARYKYQLAEYEAKLPEYDKEKNQTKKDVLYKAGRIMVSVLLSQLITEAKYFYD